MSDKPQCAADALFETRVTLTQKLMLIYILQLTDLTNNTSLTYSPFLSLTLTYVLITENVVSYLDAQNVTMRTEKWVFDLR